jgi:hypothetical protein
MKSSHLIWKSLTVIYLMVFLTIVVLAYRNGLPAFLMVNDKAGHVGLYGVATFLGHRAINRRRIKLWSRAVPLFPWLFGLLTIVEKAAKRCRSIAVLTGSIWSPVSLVSWWAMGWPSWVSPNLPTSTLETSPSKCCKILLCGHRSPSVWGRSPVP